ncbi:MAG: 2-succinyl-5-enolpyruvyl-6-hydroxy-3-cyclohexene-1-carboxylic-acid synthase [Verrucomicrobiota bacterium]
MSQTAPAESVLRGCVFAGVREYVVCAGARNAAIVLPLLKQDKFRVYHHFEERCAGFFAMGRVKQSRQPVAVVTTSGTAAAELLPAIIESHYQGLPLVVITADRPLAYRGTGAPQAIEQVGLFGGYVESCVDVVDGSVERISETWSRTSPIHLNVCLEEPVGDEENVRWPESLSGEVMPADVGSALPQVLGNQKLQQFCEDNEGLLVMAGPLPVCDLTSVESFLQKVGAQILADAASNLRELGGISDLVIQGGERALKRRRVTKVLRIGGVPSFRFWRDLESRTDIEVMSVLSGGFSGIARESVCIPDEWGESAWRAVPEKERRSLKANDGGDLTGILEKFSRSEPSLIRELSKVIPQGASIFLGNSLAVREWNLAATFESRHFTYNANRGANGIDGIVSTFLGVAAGEPEAWLVCGDLTALYDLAGPWIADQLPSGRRRIVVLNNGGGRIFDRLPAFSSADSEARRVVGNDHRHEFTHWAQMWGWKHVSVTHAEGLASAVEASDPHIVIEVCPDPEQTDMFWKEWEAV